jgi:hypothetical protein
VPVARDGGEAGNTVVANEIVDFTPLDICRAVITSAGAGIESRKSCAEPRHSQTWW